MIKQKAMHHPPEDYAAEEGEYEEQEQYNQSEHYQTNSNGKYQMKNHMLKQTTTCRDKAPISTKITIRLIKQRPPRIIRQSKFID